MEVKNITPTHDLSLQELYDYISECSSVVRDKTPKNAEKLFGRLLVETVGYRGGKIKHSDYIKLCGV